MATKPKMYEQQESTPTKKEVIKVKKSKSLFSTFAELDALKETALVKQLEDLTGQYVVQTCKALFILRKKIAATQGWKEYIEDELPNWKSYYGSTQRARLLNLGEFLYRNNLEDLEGVSLSGFYELAAVKDKFDDNTFVADIVYLDIKDQDYKVEEIRERLDKAIKDNKVVATIEKEQENFIEDLTEKQKLKLEKQQIIEREKELKKEEREKDKVNNKYIKLQEKIDSYSIKLKELKTSNNIVLQNIEMSDEKMINKLLDILDTFTIDVEHKKYILNETLKLIF